MKRLIAGFLMATLCAGAGVASAQNATEETKKAGEATKEAGKDTADAAKHAGKATGKATKKGVTNVKNAVTGDVSAKCNDGKRHSGHSKIAACADYGGVAK